MKAQKTVTVDVPFKTSVGHLRNTSVKRRLHTIHFGVVHVEGVKNYSEKLNVSDGRNFSLISNNTMFIKKKKQFDDCRLRL
jgi:hypothetical protein